MISDMEKVEMLNRFKKYVNTYSDEHFNTEEGFILDMIYGIGISVDHDKYSFHDGFRKFMEYISQH